MSAQATELPPIEAPTARTPAQLVGVTRGRLEKAMGLPTRPKKAERDSAVAWMLEAVCTKAPDDERLAFVDDGLTQADAWPLVERYCGRCPVAEACLEDGRRSHLSGLAGGIVLQDGYLAPDRPSSPYLTPDAWIAPWDREEGDQPLELPDLVELARHGITAMDAAVALLGIDGAKGRTDVGRRHLKALEREGQLRKEAAVVGEGGHPTRWWPLEDAPSPRGQRWQPRRKNRRRRR